MFQLKNILKFSILIVYFLIHEKNVSKYQNNIIVSKLIILNNSIFFNGLQT